MTVKVYNFVLFGLTLVIGLSCSNDTTIEGKLIDRQSGNVISDYTLSFTVVTGLGGILSGAEKAKYTATSDENGIIRFKAEKDDIDNYFWVEELDDCRVNHIQSRYIFDHNAEIGYLSNGNTNTLYFKPGGLIKFYVPQQVLDEVNSDYVVVSSEYDSDTLIGTKHNKHLYIEPGTVHRFMFEAIKDGQVSLVATKEITVEPHCLNGTTFYPVSFN